MLIHYILKLRGIKHFIKRGQGGRGKRRVRQSERASKVTDPDDFRSPDTAPVLPPVLATTRLDAVLPLVYIVIYNIPKWNAHKSQHTPWMVTCFIEYKR